MSISGSGSAFGERAEYGPEDVCYRHPGVHSFTLCQRCGRTICADCQNVSAVGVLCPDCTKQTQPGASRRIARSSRVTGRRVAALDAPVTYGIMALCVLVFLGQMASHYFAADEVTRALWYAPLYSLPVEFEPWRMVTAMFTHSTGFIFHILFNMYALWLFGRNLEQMIGRFAFLTLYVFAGIGGSLGVMYWTFAEPASMLGATVGASGAIFGVLTATLVAFRAARVNVTSLAVLIAINFGIGLIPGAAISWQAHLGGMVVGAITMWALLATRGPRFKTRRIILLVVIGVVLVALACGFFVATPNLAAVTG